MSKLVVCSSCLGFVNNGASACPHCDAPQVTRTTTGKIVKTVIAAVAGLGFMSTMMACYGCPDCSQDAGQDTGATDTSPNTDVQSTDTAPITDTGPAVDASASDTGATDAGAPIDGGG